MLKGEFYQNTPAVTENDFGQGQAFYVGTQLAAKGLDYLVGQLIDQFGWEHYATSEAVEITRRDQADASYYFIINNGGNTEQVNWTKAGQDLLSKQAVATGTLALDPYAVKLIKVTK
ncbi:MAG: beta-galactosidase trimerization domain-containing protein [Lactobacillaceae bacterium]|jgi:beta-galactosidase|nr:beta-galactosidase trimerization domain-containing protein [Lactobacillaceae bacterium]